MKTSFEFDSEELTDTKTFDYLKYIIGHSESTGLLPTGGILLKSKFYATLINNKPIKLFI